MSVQKSIQDSKNDEQTLESNFNDSEKGAQEIDNVEIPVNITETPDVVSTNECTNDLSKNSDSFVNLTTFKKPTILTTPKRSRPEHKVSKTEDTNSRESQSIYTEPSWGGKPKGNYKIEVLKSGVILETVSLSEQSFHLIGRLPSCHLSLAHPTVSRYHAVLQYRCEEDKENSQGFYIYDLGSTHGTFWNGNRIKPNVYVRVRGGHMLRFGCSQRKYIVQTPPEDQEEESQFTLTELKEMRASELEKRAKERIESPVEDKESEGIDWGMGEDADEETDLQENPYASIADEDLVLDDPKKTLRGWFEREGHDLHYQTEEKGLGQFLCWVNLPTEDIVGHTTRAEALVKGKKKEAVLQCALEACKILDRYGLLRQANHESRKRKTRNWEAEDYYDSDEDNFLDRTGSVERKRAQRMRLAGKLEEKIETYDSLLEKHKKVTERLSHVLTSIEDWQNANRTNKRTIEEDALDAFMSHLSSAALTKSDIAKMKFELQGLRKEEASLIKLLNLARPANLPPLSCHNVEDQTVCQAKVASKTKKVCSNKEKQTTQHASTNNNSPTIPVSNAIPEVMKETSSVEEMDSDDNDELMPDSSNASLPKKDYGLQLKPSNLPVKSTSIGKIEKQRGNHTRIGGKHKQEEQKVRCDQDVYASNYSTWVPPQDQEGDGKTSLNKIYGY